MPQKGPIEWFLPWACPDCQHHGHVKVVVQHGAMTSDEKVERSMGVAHRAVSDICIRPPARMLMGRLWRFELGRPIWMLKKGETQETFHPEKWPPWGKTN